MLELYLTPLSEIPIKKIDPIQQKPFIELVDQIREIARGKDYSSDVKWQTEVKECERQIDQMVYKLYGLTKGEIKIVEGDSSAQSASGLLKNHLDKARSV